MFLILFLKYFAAAGFFNIPGKYENVVLILKNRRNRNKCFQKKGSDHEKLKKNYEISTLYISVEK